MRPISKSIGPRIVNNYSFLKSIQRTRCPIKRNSLINKAQGDQLLCLVEICSNILKERFNLTPKQRSRLYPYVNLIRNLSRARSENKARHLVQKGSGIPAFIPALLAPI